MASSAAAASQAASSSKAAVSSILNFTRLSKTVAVHRGTGSSGSSKRPSTSIVPPRCIIVFGWMDAPMRLVSKYVEPWAERFPSATIVVKLSSGRSYLTSKDAQRKALEQVLDLLQDEAAKGSTHSALSEQIQELEMRSESIVLDTDTKDKLRKRRESVSESTATLVDSAVASSSEKVDESGVLVPSASSSSSPSTPASPYGLLIHSFSDGGAGNLDYFLSLVAARKSAATSTFPPARGVVFDCSPGLMAAHSGSTAFSLAIRNVYLRAIVRGCVYVFLRIVLAIKALLRSPTRHDLFRARLNKAATWRPLRAEQSGPIDPPLPPRAYLYTRSDALIDWRAVEAHAKEAARVQGLVAPALVRMEKVEGASDADEDQEAQQLEKGSESTSSLVQLRRWETPAHCAIGKKDHHGYWQAVDDFCSAALKE